MSFIFYFHLFVVVFFSIIFLIYIFYLLIILTGIPLIIKELFFSSLLVKISMERDNSLSIFSSNYLRVPFFLTSR